MGSGQCQAVMLLPKSTCHWLFMATETGHITHRSFRGIKAKPPMWCLVSWQPPVTTVITMSPFRNQLLHFSSINVAVRMFATIRNMLSAWKMCLCTQWCMLKALCPCMLCVNIKFIKLMLSPIYYSSYLSAYVIICPLSDEVCCMRVWILRPVKW